MTLRRSRIYPNKEIRFTTNAGSGSQLQHHDQRQVALRTAYKSKTHGGTTKSSTAVKRLMKEINGLSSVDKKELATTLMGLALIEDEQHEESLRTNSKPGKSAPEGANGGGGGIPEEEVICWSTLRCKQGC